MEAIFEALTIYTSILSNQQRIFSLGYIRLRFSVQPISFRYVELSSKLDVIPYVLVHDSPALNEKSQWSYNNCANTIYTYNVFDLITDKTGRTKHSLLRFRSVRILGRCRYIGVVRAF